MFLFTTSASVQALRKKSVSSLSVSGLPEVISLAPDKVSPSYSSTKRYRIIPLLWLGKNACYVACGRRDFYASDFDFTLLCVRQVVAAHEHRVHSFQSFDVGG